MATRPNKRPQAKRKAKAIPPTSRSDENPPRRRRFPPAERERMIVDAAIHFFAEEGFHVFPGPAEQSAHRWHHKLCASANPGWPTCRYRFQLGVEPKTLGAMHVVVAE